MTRWSVVTLDPGKKQMNNPFYYSLTRRSREQVLPTRARNNDTWDRRRIVNNIRWSSTSSSTCGPQTCGCRGLRPHSSYRPRATHIPESRSTRTWGWICWIISFSGVAETWWDAGGILHARTPTHSPPDVKTGRSTPRSLYTLLYFCMPLFCLLRVWLFALGESINLTYDMGNGRFNAHSERRGSKYSNMLAGASYGCWLSKI